MIRIHGLKSCNACRKALAELRASGHAADLRDVRDMPLTPAEITRFLKAFGDALVNRRSATLRNLPDTERSRDPTVLLADHPTVMKRPVFETERGLALGSLPPDWTEAG